MSDIQQHGFDFDFNPNFDIFGDEMSFDEPESLDEVGIDPGVFLPNEEGRSEFLAPDPERVPTPTNYMSPGTEEYAARPAAERTRELFAYMNPHRRVLYAVLRAANEPISNDNLNAKIEEIRAHKFSVYSPANICTMLEQAGSLERITEDGTPYGEFEPVPDIVLIDGEEYWKPVPAPEVFWRTTDTGRDVLEANDPVERTLKQLEREAEFKALYKRTLLLCAQGNGASMSTLSTAIDSDPLISKPRKFFVQHFVESLERCECVQWNGSAWAITEVGQKCLDEMLADVEAELDLEAADQAESTSDSKTGALESQGVCW